MDRRRSTIALLTLLGSFASPVAHAQSSTRPRRIGLLVYSNSVASRSYLAIFYKELAKLGWVDGQNLSLIFRFAEGDSARLPALADELVALEPDVLFGPNPSSAVALAHATSRIPLVVNSGAEPIAVGLVKSLARPGGNVTGVSGPPGREVEGKRLEILKGWLPRLSRIALIYDPGETTARGLGGFVGLQEHARAFGIQVAPFVARDLAEIRLALNALSKERPDAVWVYADAVNYTNRELICTEVTRMGLPTMADAFLYADSGCLASYSSSPEETIRECVSILDQILRGASPADIPFRQPTRFELVINARTAAAIGLAIPPSVRLRADRVIE